MEEDNQQSQHQKDQKSEHLTNSKSYKLSNVTVCACSPEVLAACPFSAGAPAFGFLVFFDPFGLSGLPSSSSPRAILTSLYPS